MNGFYYNMGNVEPVKSFLSLAASMWVNLSPGDRMYFAMKLHGGFGLTPEHLARMYTFIDKHRADGRTDSWICDHARDMYLEWQKEEETKRITNV